MNSDCLCCQRLTRLIELERGNIAFLPKGWTGQGTHFIRMDTEEWILTVRPFPTPGAKIIGTIWTWDVGLWCGDAYETVAEARPHNRPHFLLEAIEEAEAAWNVQRQQIDGDVLQMGAS